MDGEHPLFTTRFVETLRSLVERHHSIYPRIPPQGIFFESLVERAFLAVGWPRNQVIPTAPNSPSHDLTVGAAKYPSRRKPGWARGRLVSASRSFVRPKPENGPRERLSATC